MRAKTRRNKGDDEDFNSDKRLIEQKERERLQAEILSRPQDLGVESEEEVVTDTETKEKKDDEEVSYRGRELSSKTYRYFRLWE